MNYPTQLVEAVSLLPDSVDQRILNERGLAVVQGLTRTLAEQLVENSRQPHIGPNCPNDAVLPGDTPSQIAKKRFRDIDAVMAWQAKGRLSLPLVSGLGSGVLTLEGFGWMGPGVPGEGEPAIPGASITYAERLYESALDKGNATPYARVMLAAHLALYDSNGGVWLEAWADNLAATKTYRNAGFEVFTTIPGEMNGTPRDRTYMVYAGPLA